MPRAISALVGVGSGVIVAVGAGVGIGVEVAGDAVSTAGALVRCSDVGAGVAGTACGAHAVSAKLMASSAPVAEAMAREMGERDGMSIVYRMQVEWPRGLDSRV